MSYSPTFLADFQLARPASNTPGMKNKKLENQYNFIQSAYNRVFLSLKSQHTIFIALLEMVQQLNSEDSEGDKNEKDKETLSKFKKILHVILKSSYGNLFQINFAAADLIEEILNPPTEEQNISSNHLSAQIESLGYKILSACLAIKRLVSILSFTNYISTQLRYSKTEKIQDINNFNNSQNYNNDPELIEAEDDYQFDTFDSGARVSSLGEKRGFPLIGYQRHKKSHHSKEKGGNQNNTKNLRNSNHGNDPKETSNTTNTNDQISTEIAKTENPENGSKSETKTDETNQVDVNHNKNPNDQISTENSTNEKSPENDKNDHIYDNIFHMVDDSTIPDSDVTDYEEDGYYSEYYYDSDDEYDKPPTVICRICEKEVPLSMIEEHSKSCVNAYESSRTMKSANDRMRKLQAFAQQTVLHVEWPCNEDYAKTVVIPVLHVVALLDRAISIDLNSNGASEELDLIGNFLNAISIVKPQISSPVSFNESKPIPPSISKNDRNNDQKKKPSSSSITPTVHFTDIKSNPNNTLLKRNRSATVTPSSSTSTPTDHSKITNITSPDLVMQGSDYQGAITILSRARGLVNEKATAAISLSHAIDVYKQTTYLDPNDVSAFIRKEVTIADFSFIRRISSGAYAKVYLTRKTQTGDLSATKVIHRDSLRQKNDLQRVMVEKNILSLISNPFMIRFCMLNLKKKKKKQYKTKTTKTKAII